MNLHSTISGDHGDVSPANPPENWLLVLVSCGGRCIDGSTRVTYYRWVRRTCFAASNSSAAQRAVDVPVGDHVDVFLYYTKTVLTKCRKFLPNIYLYDRMSTFRKNQLHPRFFKRIQVWRPSLLIQFTHVCHVNKNGKQSTVLTTLFQIGAIPL